MILTSTAAALGLAASLAAAASQPTADQIIDRMDQNLTFESRRSRITMVVKDARTERRFEMVSFARGEEDAAIEYVAPPREKGTRMLKLGDQLWIYMPTIDRVQKISGHMLRQGMMGSDVSYEDMMASREMRSRYRSTLSGERVHDGRPCWALELVAVDDTVAYPKRVMLVDKETYIPLLQELYALSGMLLKTWTMSEVKTFPGNRRFATRMTIVDHVKKGSQTELHLDDIEFGVKLQNEIFARRWLERR